MLLSETVMRHGEIDPALSQALKSVKMSRRQLAIRLKLNIRTLERIINKEPCRSSTLVAAHVALDKIVKDA